MCGRGSVSVSAPLATASALSVPPIALGAGGGTTFGVWGVMTPGCAATACDRSDCRASSSSPPPQRGISSTMTRTSQRFWLRCVITAGAGVAAASGVAGFGSGVAVPDLETAISADSLGEAVALEPVLELPVPARRLRGSGVKRGNTGGSDTGEMRLTRSCSAGGAAGESSHTGSTESAGTRASICSRTDEKRLLRSCAQERAN